jgi:elongation factor 1-alpha
MIVGVNKMDCDVAKYGEERFKEVKDEMVNMLLRVGWKKDKVAKEIPVIPISGWMGDNLIKKSEKMAWWKGVDVIVPSKDNAKIHIDTLVDALDKMVTTPKRDESKKMRTPISGVYKIKGVGDVLTGRVEQGVVKPNEEVIFLPLGVPGKVFSVEMHKKSVPMAHAGDNVGLNIKGLTKDAMPRAGDVMIHKGDDTLKKTKNFVAQVQVLNHPGELKVGYTPICFVRTGRSAVKMTEITWKIGKETGGQKAESPNSLKANEMAQVNFEPQQPFVCDGFKQCEGLGRCAIMEGGTVVMLGKIIKVEFAD